MNVHYGMLCLGSVLTLVAAGCGNQIGDDCNNSADCSYSGDRICDTAQPNGYCTVQGCESGTCPDGARCVSFRPSPERLAETWCMAKCGDNGDCRDESKEGYRYRCVTADDLGTQDGTPEGEPLAKVTDEGKANAKFCTAVPE